MFRAPKSVLARQPRRSCRIFVKDQHEAERNTRYKIITLDKSCLVDVQLVFFDILWWKKWPWHGSGQRKRTVRGHLGTFPVTMSTLRNKPGRCYVTCMLPSGQQAGRSKVSQAKILAGSSGSCCRNVWFVGFCWFTVMGLPELWCWGFYQQWVW